MNMTTVKRLLAILLTTCVSIGATAAVDTAREVKHLLDAIGSSECVFIRNGRRYDAEKAEAHLRMKYTRGKRYASTAEKFIERLASRSSISKKLYYIECKNENPIASGDWLLRRLAEYRDRTEQHE